ncbi:MAG: tetratricopeptide repeat protein [Alphaproteobacteria bacterium]|nr:tetratricopeptide repeat protein [Alphaproteobacteria bacterium]
MTSQALHAQAFSLYREGRIPEADRLYRQILTRNPADGEALYRLALLLFQQRRPADAVAMFDRLLALAPGLAEAWTDRGGILQDMGQLPDALASYDRAVALKPDHAPAWLNRGIALQALGRFADALGSFDKVLGLLPRHAAAWRGRASALVGLERIADALASFDKALEILPGDPAILRQRAIALGMAKQPDEIPAGLEEMDAWHKRASMFHVTGRLTDALDALDHMLALQPDHPPALAFKAAILCEAKRVPEGVALYRRHAETVHGAAPVTQNSDPPHKQRHDAEQRAYLAAQGVDATGFHLEPGARLDGPAVNPGNRDDVARRWRESRPQIVVIDNLLTAPALEALRRFCWGSTMWQRPYEKGYLGAVPARGFACPLLAQIADELREVFPAVIGDHGLGLMWGFKYDSSLSGIPMHADQAAVNVNFWITPDEANRNPGSGGLVVWDVKAPQDWDFERYNADVPGMRAFLAKESAKPIVVPHRANRAVIFDSDLFHETDQIEFRDGYQNRRINVTMLYGRRTFHGG